MDLNETFLKVIEDHRGILYKIVRSYCKSEEDRKDLIQEIIFQLWKSFKSMITTINIQHGYTELL